MDDTRSSVRHGRQPHRLPPVRVPVPALHPPHRRPRVRPASRSRLVAAATWSALGVAVLLLLALAVAPRLGLYRVNVVLSGSMEPRWSAGDLVVSKPVRTRDLRVGQVITYNPPIDGRPSVTHRIVTLSQPGPHPVVLTKGDANQTADTWGAVRLDAPEVQVVVASVPHVGRLLALLQTRVLTVVTGLIVPLLLLAAILHRIWAPPRAPRPS